MKNIIILITIMFSLINCFGSEFARTAYQRYWYANELLQKQKSINTLVTRKFCYNVTGETDLLSVEITAGQSYINLTTDDNISNYIVGEYLEILNDHSERILIIGKESSATNTTIELDWPIQYNYAISNTIIFPCTTNFGRALLTTNATRTSPITFQIGVGNKEIFHCDRMIISGADGTASSYVNFVGIPELSNGLLIGFQHIGPPSEILHYHHLADVHTNGDFINLMFDFTFPLRVANVYGVQGRWTLSNFSGGVKLDGSKNEKFTIDIRDDLTDITDLQISIQGWIEVIE